MQVRIDLDDALELLDADEDEAIVAAGEALAVLDEDEAAGELMYVHPLVQECFAARILAREPDPELVRSAWRAAEIRPGVKQVIDALDPADPLPGLPQTGWEETTMLAAAMTEDPAGFLRDLMGPNLALAGRAAAQPELHTLLPSDLLDALRWALVERSRDPAADLRERIACGSAVGDLGDPRLERRLGPHGEYLLPPRVSIPGGVYPLGDGEGIEWSDGTTTAHVPRHEVELAGYTIGQFPVMNAEWSCFMESGGYEDERWWDTEAARAWRRGIGTSAAIHASARHWLARFRTEPDVMDRFLEQGTFDEAVYERWRLRLEMTEEEFEAHLHELYPESRFTEPRCWREDRLNRAAQPVVGVCWFEARAYLRWLSEQSGLVFRLPTEAEWEAAARGLESRRYAYGDVFDRLRGNTTETHVRRPTPIGVFPDGDTREGVCDLTGNVYDWTSSAFGRDVGTPDFAYPYDAEDGREASDTTADLRRVVRGGSWSYDRPHARAAARGHNRPDHRLHGTGLRVLGGHPMGERGANADPGSAGSRR